MNRSNSVINKRSKIKKLIYNLYYNRANNKNINYIFKNKKVNGKK